jgi:hypothetical protein
MLMKFLRGEMDIRPFRLFGILLPLVFVFLLVGAAFAQVDSIWIDVSHPFPMTIDIGDTAWVRFDAYFSDSDFDTLFMHIPNRPAFFQFWRERRLPGPGNYIYDKIIFTPGMDDGGFYPFTLIVGGIRRDGTIVADTLVYELRVRPMIFPEPEYTGGTTNTLRWLPSRKLYDQWIYILDVETNVSMPAPRQLNRASLVEFINTFENLQHGKKYGYFILGFTKDSVVVHSDTVYSIQDALPPDPVTVAYGHEGPAKTVDLYWEPVSDATSFVKGYVVHRRAEDSSFVALDTVWVQGNETPPLHYWDSPGDLIEGMKYFYKITALDAGLNEGEGIEFGPFIPDATPPPPPVFYWHTGYGYDYESDYTSPQLKGMGYGHKTWYKRGLENTVYVYNPVYLPQFSGLFRADSVRFQAVRDSSKFFEDEWQPGMQFFESWSSPWISVDDVSDSLVAYTFDFTNGGANPFWFVHSHFYKFRAQFKDRAGNVSEWSRVNEQGWLVGAYQDAAPPADIPFLQMYLFEDSTRQGGGYVRLHWQAAIDSVSGVGYYRVFRRLGQTGEWTLIDSVQAASGDNVYEEDFADVPASAQVFYRVVGVDHVGNAREVEDTRWEVGGRLPIPPVLVFADQYPEFNGRLYTRSSQIQVQFTRFDPAGVQTLVLFVNGDSLLLDPAQLQVNVPVREGVNRIYAVAVFDDGARSLPSNRLEIWRDSAAPARPALFEARVDTGTAGDIYLHWAAAADRLPVRYLLFRREAGTSTWTEIGRIDQTEFVDRFVQPSGSTLRALQKYEYRIIPVDALGNRADTSAVVASSYSNRAPLVNRVHFFADSLQIAWSYPSYPDSCIAPRDSLRFDIRIFAGLAEVDPDTSQFFLQETVIGRTDITVPIEPGNIYSVYVRAIELVSGEFRGSAWSIPRRVDTGRSIIPAVDTLLTQYQPFDTTGIYVSWEEYWKHPFWNDHSTELVAYVEVFRWQSGKSDTVKWTFWTEDTVFQQSGFMDQTNLQPNARYVYQVIPYEQKANDPPRYVPAGNDSARVLNDTSMVRNYVDRAFIPVLDHLYSRNPVTGKKYFSLVGDGDSLRVEWFWVYEESGIRREAGRGDFRGAEKLEIYLANNPEFRNDPGYKYFTRKKVLRKSELTNVDDFYYTYFTGLLDPDSFNLYEGKSIFVKIKAFDRWGHSPLYPSTAEIDGVEELVLDQTPPTAVPFGFRVQSTQDTTEVALVDLYFHWSPSTDQVSGLRRYVLQIESRENGKDSLLYEYPDISPEDTTFVIRRFELSDFYFEHPVFFRLFPEDYAGNRNTEIPPLEFRFFEAPQIISAAWADTTGRIELTWTKVPAADRYLIVWMGDKSYFSDELRNSPAQREFVDAHTFDPDTIRYVLNRAFNPASRWFFRMLAQKGDRYESSWSNFMELAPVSGSSSKNPIAGLEEEAELPSEFALYQNYPNPFNPSTTITFDLPKAVRVKILVVDLNGRIVRRLLSQELPPGRHQVIWDGTDAQGRPVASGVYLYMIRAGEFRQMKKCLLLK